MSTYSLIVGRSIALVPRIFDISELNSISQAKDVTRADVAVYDMCVRERGGVC